MTEPVLKVEGLNRLVRTLTRAKVDISDLKRANQTAGEIVAAAARASAPRRDGNLAGSIRAAKQARRARIMAGNAAVPYAAPIHWGWPARNIAANPWISQAARATEGQWTEQYRADVIAALSNVKGA